MFQIKRRLFRASAKYTKSFCTLRGVTKNIQNCKASRALVQNEGVISGIGQPTYLSHPHLLKPNEITPNIFKDEFKKRREKLIELVLKSKQKSNNKGNDLIIIPASNKKYMSDKIPYVFRQNTDFLYLTGCQEPDCCLVITINESFDRSSSILFTRNKDEHSELWDGPRTSPDGAIEFFGVDQSFTISELEKFIYNHRKSTNNLTIWYDMTPINEKLHQTVEHFLQSCTNELWQTPKNLIHRLRLFKSQSEIDLMQKSCDITANAFEEAIKYTKNNVNESQIFATVDYICRMNGAEFLAYPPVVAGGNRATTIHYINNDNLVQDGELVLMDAGCEYHGYASDVTRTWPVNGVFSKEQKEIYEVVLNTQQSLIEYCETQPTLDGLFNKMCEYLGKGLQEIGLIKPQLSKQYLLKAAYQFCPHHVSHYLGMDVHDTGSIGRNIKIQPGMVITIEPGVYINHLGKNDVPINYRGIGIRIEDDVLITENGPVVLSRNCPKSVQDIERLAMTNINL